MVLARVCRTISLIKNVLPSSECGSDAHQQLLFCFLGCGYAHWHMTTVPYFHRVQHVSMVQKRQGANTAPENLKTISSLFPSIIPSLLRTRVTQTLSAYAKSKGNVSFSTVDRVVILKTPSNCILIQELTAAAPGHQTALVPLHSFPLPTED